VLSVGLQTAIGVDAIRWHQGVSSEDNDGTASTAGDAKIVLLQCSNTDILTELALITREERRLPSK
jgi:hypothetical protein